MHPSLFLRVLAWTWAFVLVKNVQARVVFAHYMVGSVNEDHVRIDIDQAKAAGIQGFSLNIADPSAPFVDTTLRYMFAYAPSVGFHLHISMDIWASGDAQGGHPDLYNSLLQKYMHVPGYFTFNGVPYVTTFSDGGLSNDQWDAWRTALGSPIYFCPDFDGTAGYTTGADGWWFYWGDTVDCVFSWDAAWPVRYGDPGVDGKPPAGSASEGSIEIDTAVIKSASSRGKQYNMPLSTLQYKNAYGTNIYRPGDLTLPNRMFNILQMPIKPDFVTIITWNDGPESHYIGNVWPEQNTDSDPARYVSAGSRWDHSGWQTLIKSFSAAYLSGGPSMLPSSTNAVEGAIWYSGVMMSSVCPSGSYPQGWEVGDDVISWAFVVGTSLSNLQMRITSGDLAQTLPLVGSGLHFGTVPKHPRQQLVEILSGTTTIAVAQGGRCVSTLCPDNIFNMNQIVAGLSPPSSAPPQSLCEDPVCADANSRRDLQTPPISPRQQQLDHPRAFRRQSEDYNFYAANPGRISTDLMVGALDGDGNRQPRENCVFYVNQRDVDAKDPNYAKNRAVQFADLMNAAYPGYDFHTLYDVYDTASAFSYTENPMASAWLGGLLRPWFQTTSKAYADLCRGHLFLIVEREPEEIWDQSIWVTHEWPAIVNGGQVTSVTEIRPEDVGTAVDHNGATRYIRYYPYRGGQPPGATPPRDDAQAEIAGCVSIDPNASDARWAGVVDVPGDISPFKEGVCTMHVHQWYNENAGGGPFGDPNYQATYSVEVTLYDDGATHKIGFKARTDAPYQMMSKIDQLFGVTPVEDGDYIRFSLGTQTFRSDDGSCSVGDYDHGADRQMDCGFPCSWGGADSTDRTQLGVYLS